MTADGSDRKNLTETPKVAEDGPAWSPDGREIAFVKHEGKGSDLYTMSVDGSGVRRVTDTLTVNESTPAYSREGTQIFYSGLQGQTNDLYVIDRDGEATHLTNTSELNEYAPIPSPDSERIFFAASRPSRTDPQVLNTDLYSINIDGADRRNLTDNPVLADVPPQGFALAPDGSRIFFVGLRTGARDPDIWVVDIDGGDPHVIARAPRISFASGLALSPNGERIAFEGTEEGPGIYVMNSDGSKQSRLAGGRVGDQAPAWSPASR